MRILVTGGCGFIGSHWVDRLINLGHEVDVVDDMSTGLLSNHNREANLFQMDVDRFCNRYDFKYDRVYHFANCARIARSFDFPRETLVNNLTSTVAICEYVRKTGSGPLIYASSSTTNFTDHLNNPYTLSKYHCDQVLELYKKHFNLDYSIVKFYNVYGSMREADLGVHTTIIRKFKQLTLENKPLTVIGTGERRRDFTHIDDTVNALQEINGIAADQLQPVYDIGTGKNYKIIEIAQAFNQPIDFIEDRAYELQETKCVHPYTRTTVDVIEHIKQWRKTHGIS